MQGNLREYYIMPQETLREKLVGRIYGIRKAFEDGLFALRDYICDELL